MHATLSHDTPVCVQRAPYSTRYSHGSRFPADSTMRDDDYRHASFCPDTDSLGIGNEKGAMITHHAFATLTLYEFAFGVSTFR